MGVAWAVAVEERRVGFAVQVTDLSVKTCRKVLSALTVVYKPSLKRRDVLVLGRQISSNYKFDRDWMTSEIITDKEKHLHLLKMKKCLPTI